MHFCVQKKANSGTIEFGKCSNYWVDFGMIYCIHGIHSATATLATVIPHGAKVELHMRMTVNP